METPIAMETSIAMETVTVVDVAMKEASNEQKVADHRPPQRWSWIRKKQQRK
jgi:hypothetical protein